MAKPLELVIATGDVALEIYRPSATNITVQPTSNPTAGPTGPRGPSFLTIDDVGDLNSVFGIDGDYAVLTTSDVVTIYGPKATTWPSTPVTVLPRGNSILSVADSSELVPELGVDGDYAVDLGLAGFTLYGPKTGGVWSLTGVSVTTPNVSSAARMSTFLYMGG